MDDQLQRSCSQASLVVRGLCGSDGIALLFLNQWSTRYHESRNCQRGREWRAVSRAVAFQEVTVGGIGEVTQSSGEQVPSGNGGMPSKLQLGVVHGLQCPDGMIQALDTMTVRVLEIAR